MKTKNLENITQYTIEQGYVRSIGYVNVIGDRCQRQRQPTSTETATANVNFMYLPLDIWGIWKYKKTTNKQQYKFKTYIIKENDPTRNQENTNKMFKRTLSK